jgi:hypothetical protein
MNKSLPKNYKSVPTSIKKEFNSFCKNIPRMTYLKGVEVSHLYHGSRKNRQYVDRHELLNLDVDIRDLLEVSKDGLFEWKDPKLNHKFLKYFISRKDDEGFTIIKKLWYIF